MLAGNEIKDPVNMGEGIGNVGLEICYDLRFPEMHSILVDRGAGTLVFPSAFTLRTGRDHWGQSPFKPEPQSMLIKDTYEQRPSA